VGLFGGIVAATFASMAGEPAIDDAIAIEEANAAAQPEDPAGSRGWWPRRNATDRRPSRRRRFR